MWTSAAVPGCATSIVDKGVRIPQGLVVGEDPDDDARRFSRSEKGRLPDHQTDDRPSCSVTAPSRFWRSPPRFSARSRQVASPMWWARCRRRWPPRASRCDTLIPGYPRRAACAGRRRACRCTASPTCSAGRPGCCAAQRGGARPAGDRRAASLRPAGQSVSGAGRAGLAGQRVAVRGARACGGADCARGGGRRVSRRTSCTCMTGRRGWRWPICTIGAAGGPAR